MISVWSNKIKNSHEYNSRQTLVSLIVYNCVIVSPTFFRIENSKTVKKITMLSRSKKKSKLIAPLEPSKNWNASLE